MQIGTSIMGNFFVNFIIIQQIVSEAAFLSLQFALEQFISFAILSNRTNGTPCKIMGFKCLIV